MCIQTAAALQTWMLHYELIIHAKAEELNKITNIGPLCDFVFECNQNLQRFLLILNPFHLSLIAAQQKTRGGSIKLCNTTCSTVHKNVPNVVLVLCCWVTGNEFRAGSDRLLHFLLLRAFYHICCFEMVSVIFVSASFYFMCLLPRPSCTDPSTQILQSWVYW